MTQNSSGAENHLQHASQRLCRAWPTWLKRFLAGNPLYLASAGLFLYGINTVTTDSRFVGAEDSLLRFNFCALALYELILVITAIALARRSIWYDAILLAALANVFVIVPFSLISRAVYLSPGLAWTMSLCATVFAALKIWAFQRFIPEFNLPRRMLIFGALLLLVNAATPLRFKTMAERPAQISHWLTIICFGVLPLLAGLANFLPKPVETSSSPVGKRWVPLAIYLGWVVVTALHVLGIGYSAGRDWSFSLLIPTAWALGWTIYLRLNDFTSKPSLKLQQMLLLLPLTIPLFGSTTPWLLPLLSGLNLCAFASRLLKDRSRVAIAQFLAAAVILLCGLPLSWVQHIMPGLRYGEWVLCSLFICFFWLVFVSRDPRVGFLAAVSLVVMCGFGFRQFSEYAPQTILVFLLLHSLRWDDPAHRGARFLRNAAGLLLLLTIWQSLNDGYRLHYASVLVLLICYAAHALHTLSSRPRAVAIYALFAVFMEPVIELAGQHKQTSAGFIAIGVSFILFGLGSLAAFTKSRWNRSALKPTDV
jgi:hypothetical protein